MGYHEWKDRQTQKRVRDIAFRFGFSFHDAVNNKKEMVKLENKKKLNGYLQNVKVPKFKLFAKREQEQKKSIKKIASAEDAAKAWIIDPNKKSIGYSSNEYLDYLCTAKSKENSINDLNNKYLWLICSKLYMVLSTHNHDPIIHSHTRLLQN